MSVALVVTYYGKDLIKKQGVRRVLMVSCSEPEADQLERGHARRPRSFLPSGRLRVTAKRLLRSRETQIWEGRITDRQGRNIANGQLRLICLKDGAPLTNPIMDLTGL